MGHGTGDREAGIRGAARRPVGRIGGYANADTTLLGSSAKLSLVQSFYVPSALLVV